ncbi:MAG: glycosyltransferase, partial [Clostridia bacterium]|nr:glycosyltransferase [Clostridia bacterium]
MNVIARKWNTLRYAWKYGGTPAVIKLFKELKYRPQIRRMLKEHAQRDQIYDQWFRQSLPGQEERALQHGRVFHHTLSYLIPTYNTRPDLLRSLADSFLAQTCDAWEVCMYDGASTNESTLSMLKQLSEEDPRFHVVFGKENLGISGNTNKALVLASSDYVALCDHDDLLTPDCTYWILDAAERGADFIYSDEDKTNEDESLFFDPHMKPDFSPDALRSGNYICHIMAMSTELMRSLSGLRSCCDGSQDHDLALRATEKAVAIAHIPKVLYHWRMLNTSFSHSSSERCANAAVRAVQDQLDRLHLNGSAENRMLQTYVSYSIPDDARVSLIIHSLDGGFDKAWAHRILKFTNEETRSRICELLVVGASGQLPDLMGIPVHAVLSIDEASQTAKGSLLTFL